MGVTYLGLAEFLLVAKETLDVEAGVLARMTDLGLADMGLRAPAAEWEGQEFYPNFIDKAAVLTARLVKNHPLPDGNKRVAFECLRTFLDLNGYKWVPPVGEGGAVRAVIEVMTRLASGELDEQGFAEWLSGCVELEES